MREKSLNIVCLDTPLPANYGGAIGMYSTIKTLHKIGVKIYLHCFTKSDYRPGELYEYCEEVNYYYRNTGIAGISVNLPYIVYSRRAKNILENILKNDFPILFEGIHSSYHYNSHLLKNRKKILRLHNVEFLYYKILAKYETNIFRKIYYSVESFFLYNYEKRVGGYVNFLSPSMQDTEVYKDLFSANGNFLPVFIPWENVKSKLGLGNYCLYQANLSVNENEKIALWLIRSVFANLNYKLVIAGKNPSNKLLNAVKYFENVELVPSPDENYLSQLIADAQIVLLHSLNITGVKLKLLNALFNGRHCMSNSAGVSGSGLEELCIIANSVEETTHKIETMMQEEFTESSISLRSEILLKSYCNEKNAQELLTYLY